MNGEWHYSSTRSRNDRKIVRNMRSNAQNHRNNLKVMDSLYKSGGVDMCGKRMRTVGSCRRAGGMAAPFRGLADKKVLRQKFL